LTLIIFDLDGTIVDSRLDLANSTNEMLGTYGAPELPVDQVGGFVGEGARVLVQRALAASGLPPDIPGALDRFRGIYDRRLLEHTRPYDGIDQVIRVAARQAALAVVTNKPEGPSRRLLEAFSLNDLFRWVIGGDSGFPRKPHPGSIHHVMQSAGAAQTTTLFVGDSMIDVETARRAGIRVCVAGYGFGYLRGEIQLADGELIVHRPSDLADVFEKFAGGPFHPRS
jgi:phosphoglycolate phosphatase